MRIPHGLRSALASQTGGGGSSPTTDEYFGDVSLLLYGDGTNGSTAIVDSSSNGHAITVTGDAQISTTQSKFGGSSLYFDGTGDYVDVTIDSTTLSSDFTIEAWVYRSGTSDHNFFGSLPHTVFGITINRAGTGKTALYIGNGSSWQTLDFRSTGTIATNTWTHLAVVRHNNVITIYHDGVSQGSTSTNMPTGFNGGARIGASSVYGTNLFTGYIDDYRITKGVARYTSNFTPPTASFSTVTPGEKYFYQNSLLLSADGSNGSTAIVDSSANAHTITVGGNAQISTTQGKFGGSSMYFANDSVDHLSIPASSSLQVTSTEDFTVEAWIYLDGNRTYHYIVSKGGQNSREWGLAVSTTTIYFYWSTNGLGSGDSLATASVTIPLYTWMHIAAVKNGSTISLFKDGVQQGQGTFTSIYSGNGPTYVGRFMNFGAISHAIHGYVDDLRITKGVARYTSDFAIPTSEASSTDPYFSNTKLLLNGNGTNGSTTFTDSSNSSHTVTVNGDAQISTAQSKFGGASMKFDGTADYIEVPSSTDLSFGSSDFTIECWVYFNSLQNNMTVASFPGGGNYPTIVFGHLTTLNVYATSTGGSWNILAGNSLGTPSVGVWHHIALVRSGNTYKGFFDGALSFSVVSSNNLYGTSSQVRIGAFNNTGTLGEMDGYVDDFRVTKGVARYGNFTPPTAGFSTLTPVEPYFHNNSLLLHGDGTNGSTTFKDDSINNHTITANGNAQISTTQSKFGGSSLFLDGTGDYLLINSQMSTFEFSGDFTIEGWFWFNQSNVGYQGLLGSAVNADATGFVLVTETTNHALHFYGSSNTSWNTILATTTVPTTNTWHHIAVCRSGSAVTMYLNGTSIGSTTSSNFIRSGSSLRVGGYQYFPGGERSFNGYIDELRITKGVARYTANFTPPTSAFPDL